MNSIDLNIKETYVLRRLINILADLAKVRITFFVAISTSIGFLLATSSFIPRMIFVSFGVFLLACGSSALNHFQEKDVDGLMNRTKNRPIPSGDMQPAAALAFASIWILSGSMLLYFFGNLTSLILGIVALVWYNVIYTPLKRVSALAVVPGSLIGAIPPVIGWAATGRSITEPEIIALAMFFFIWQIPHFWLLLLIHGEEYQKAGFPSLTEIFSKSQLSRITFNWIVALAISSLLIPLFSISLNLVTGVVLLILGVYLTYSSRIIISNFSSRIVIRRSFMNINIYVLLVVLLLTIDKLLFTLI